jgi:hypothetical protein
MNSRDAIALTRFRALGGPTQERLNRSSFIRAAFRIRLYMTLEARITSNFLEPGDAKAPHREPEVGGHRTGVF